MLRTFTQLFILCVLFHGTLSLAATKGAHHPSRQFGAGIILGAPSGLVGKYWVQSDRAFDMGLAFYFGDLILVYGDYLFHFPHTFKSSEKFVNQLVPYVGVGAAAIFWTGYPRRYLDTAGGFGLGVRIPLGIEWRPSDPPLGVFVELAPGVGIIPGTFGFLQGGIGARYYF